ncbi:hypothetical protein BV25DRAFT_997084 [Artomyces pyxidatus]|uniref:Uncharacterized protein n=1 Tax=Artomyces pyxidatus TaxID=48021 RepID=A0ACB8SVR2_9AGAM|nr:hypothetical protein BV25DRAFT_997084 [Artomyces pyxidatus]
MIDRCAPPGTAPRFFASLSSHFLVPLSSSLSVSWSKPSSNVCKPLLKPHSNRICRGIMACINGAMIFLRIVSPCYRCPRISYVNYMYLSENPWVPTPAHAHASASLPLPVHKSATWYKYRSSSR